MTIVGEVSVPVMPAASTFGPDLMRITDAAAARAGESAGKIFMRSFSASIKGGGAAQAVFAGTEAQAGAAGTQAGKVYARGFSEGVRINGQTAGVLNSAAPVAQAEGQGLAAGRSFSRGMAAGQREGQFSQALQGTFRSAEIGAASSGRRVGAAFASALSRGITPITAGIAAALVAVFSVVQSAKFDQQLALIQTQAGATAAQLVEIRKQSLALAPEVGIAPTKIAEAYYHAASAGFTLSQQQHLVAASSRGAQIGQADLEKTTQALIATTRSGIKGFSGMDDAMNILIRTVGIGDLRLPALVSALSTGIIPAAKSAGLSLEDVSAALAVMGDNVVPAQQAATRLRMTFSLLAAPSDKAIAQLEAIGLNGNSLANDLQKPQGLLVAIQDLKTHLDAAFPASKGHALSITEQRTALLEYTGTLRSAGISGKELANDQQKMAVALATGTSSLVLQNQAIQHIFGGGRTSGAFLTLYEEVGLLQQKYHLLGDEQSRAAFAAQAWDKQQSLLTQRFHNFTAGLEVGVIAIGHELTPAVSGLLGGLGQIPHYLTPIGVGLGDVWDETKGLVRELSPLGKLVLEAFGGVAYAAIQATAFLLRDVFAPAIHGITDVVKFFNDNRAAAIGLAAALTTLLIPAFIGLVRVQLASLFETAALKAMYLADGIKAAAVAVRTFAAANPVLLAATVAIGAAAAAVALFHHNSTSAKVDVNALTDSVKNLAETGNSSQLAKGIFDQIAKWEVGSHHQTGVDYLQRYGVSANDLSAALSDPKNRGAYNTFFNSLDVGAQKALLLGDKFGGNAKEMGSFRTALESTNPAVRELATLFSDLEKDPTVRGTTVATLLGSFSKLSGGIWQTYNATKQGTLAQREYGKTFTDSSQNTIAAEIAVVNAASKGQDAVSKVDQALRLTTDNGLAMIGTIQGWNDQAASSASSLADAQTSLASAQATLGEKQTAANDAVAKFGAGSKEAVAAYNNLKDAANGVTKASEQVAAAQPPSVDSVLKKLGLDDATLKQLSGASSKLIAEGITAPALGQLMSLNDPRAILAFSEGGKGAVQALNKAVGSFLTDSGPESFASLQQQYKDAGVTGLQNFIDGVHIRKQAVADALSQTFISQAGPIFSQLFGIMSLGGSGISDHVAEGILSHRQSVIDSITATMTGPQRDAVNALEALATEGGGLSTQKLADAIRNGTPIVVSQQTALKDHINDETRKILAQWKIRIQVDDAATEKLKEIATDAKNLVNSFNSGTIGTSFAGLFGVVPAKAGGGIIMGPGTSTSDSILGVDTRGVPTARVSRDEYVVNARSTAKHRPLIEAINADRLAAGGAVGSTSTAASTMILNVDRLVDPLARLASSLSSATVATRAGLSSAGAVGGSAPAKAYAMARLAQLGQIDQWPALLTLWDHESGWNPYALNSIGAMGIPQAYGHGNVFALGDWRAQVDWGLNYIEQVYGGPARAWAQWYKPDGSGSYDAGGMLQPGQTLAVNRTTSPEPVLTAAQWRTIETMVAQIAKFGVTLTEKAATGGVSGAEKAIAAAVKEGLGPLQKALTGQLRGAEGQLYATSLAAVRDKAVSPAEYAAVQARAKAVTDLTAQLTKLNTVNSALVTSLGNFVQTQTQFRDSLQTTLSTGSGFSDLLKTSGTPGDLKGQLTARLAAVTGFTAKITQLKRRGFSNAIIRDVANDGIDSGSLYADMLLTASRADVTAIDRSFAALGAAELGGANEITRATEGSIRGIGNATAATYIQTAIFTPGADVTGLVNKAEAAARTGRATVNIEKIENNYNGADLTTAHALTMREINLALAGVGVS